MDRRGEIHLFLLNDAGTGRILPRKETAPPAPRITIRSPLDIWHIKSRDNRQQWDAPRRIWQGRAGDLASAIQHSSGRIILPNCPNFVSGVAVLATNTWAALEGARRLKVRWDLPETPDDSRRLMKSFEQALDEDSFEIGEEVLTLVYGSGDAAEVIPFFIADGGKEATRKIRFAQAMQFAMDLTQDQYIALHDGRRVTGLDYSPNNEFVIERVGGLLAGL